MYSAVVSVVHSVQCSGKSFETTHVHCSSLRSLQMVVQELGALDVKVFDEYIDRKQQPLLGILEAGMYVGSFDWEECPKVKSK